MSTSFKNLSDPKFAKLFKQAQIDSTQSHGAKAIRSAAEFLKQFPKDPYANYFMALARLRSEEMQRAREHAAVAHAADPNNADFTFLLGRIYLDLRLFEYAAPLLYGARKQHPNNYKLQWAIANFLFEIGKGPEANQHYAKAMELVGNDQDRYSIAFDYATNLNTQALTDEADDLFKLFGQKPSNSGKALEIRSRLRKFLPESDMAKQVEASIADPQTEIKTKLELMLALGKIHENAKDYDVAFELWNKSRAMNAASESRFASVAYGEQLQSLYSKNLFAAASDCGHPSTAAVFVVGMPRSGTTLAEQIIGAHQQCYGAGELGRLHMVEAEFTRRFSGAENFANAVQFCKNGELRRIADATLSLMTKLAGPTASYTIDKTPNHYASIGFSSLCLPNTKYIHCQRHPADSFISSFQNNLNETHSYAYDQSHYVQAYLIKEKLMAHWQTLFPDKIFDLKYEHLVHNPEETVRKMLNFLGLPWDENCMKFFENKTMVKTFSMNQVREPFYTSSVYRWKNYEKHLAPLFAGLKAANYEYPAV